MRGSRERGQIEDHSSHPSSQRKREIIIRAMKIFPIALQCLFMSPAGAEASGGGLGGWVEPSKINAWQEPAAVERSFVGEGTARGYMSSLVRFMMHLFDNKKEHLTPSHLEQMEAENRKDSHNFRASQTAPAAARRIPPAAAKTLVANSEPISSARSWALSPLVTGAPTTALSNSKARGPSTTKQSGTIW